MLIIKSLLFLVRRLGVPTQKKVFAPVLVFHKAWAFIVRDFQVAVSYKLDFVLQSINSLVPLLFFFFLSKLVSGPDAPGLEKFGGDYFAFVLIGLAFHRYLQLSLRMFADSIRLAQVTGCLETMLGSQTWPCTTVLMSSLYGLISTTIHLVLILAVAVMAFNFDLSQADAFAALAVFVFSMLTFIGFGILAATAIVLFKRGDPVTWIFSNLGVVLGGAYFPLEVMPNWLQKLAWINPITHSLAGLRLTLLKGHSLAMVAESIWFLAFTGAVLFPVGLALFSWSVRKGRKDGTLMQY